MTRKEIVWFFWMPFFWFVVAFTIYLWLHEIAGHYLSNLLSGVSPNQMEILWLRISNIYISPWAVGILDGEIPRITYFAGGFVAGLLFFLLSIFIFFRLYRKEKQNLLWAYFVITLGYSGVGFTEFIVEGFFTEYHRGVLEITLLAFFIVLFPPFLSAWHYRSKIIDWAKAR